MPSHNRGSSGRESEKSPALSSSGQDQDKFAASFPDRETSKRPSTKTPRAKPNFSATSAVAVFLPATRANDVPAFVDELVTLPSAPAIRSRNCAPISQMRATAPLSSPPPPTPPATTNSFLPRPLKHRQSPRTTPAAAAPATTLRH